MIKKITINRLSYLSIFLYIFLVLYMKISLYSPWTHRLVTVFFIIGSYYRIYKNKVVIINPMVKWWFLFTVYTVIGLLYAEKNIDFSEYSRLQISIMTGIILSFVIITYEDLVLVMKYIFISGFIYSTYMLLQEKDTLMIKAIGGGLLGNSNRIAELIALSLIIAIIYIKVKKINIKYIILITPMLIALLLTGSRRAAIWVIVFIISDYLYNTTVSDKYLVVRRLGRIIITIVLLFITYNILMKIPIIYNVIGYKIEMLLNFLDGKSNIYDDSLLVRSDLINYGIELIKNKPIFGHGTFSYSSLSVHEMYSHNNYIELFVNNGFIGLTMYYSIFIYYLHFIFIKIKQLKKSDKLYVVGRLLLISTFIYLLLDMSNVSYVFTYNYIYLSILTSYITILKKNIKSSVK